MFEVTIILLLAIISFIYIKFILLKYNKVRKVNTKKDMKRVQKDNVILLDLLIKTLKIFVKLLIPGYIILILFLVIFLDTQDSDIFLTIIIFMIMLICQVFYPLLVLYKKIVVKENTFEYYTLFFKKEYEYKNLKIYSCSNGNEYIYKGRKRILKLTISMWNSQVLIDKIIQINGYDCILKEKKL